MSNPKSTMGKRALPPAPTWKEENKTQQSSDETIRQHQSSSSSASAASARATEHAASTAAKRSASSAAATSLPPAPGPVPPASSRPISSSYTPPAWSSVPLSSEWCLSVIKGGVEVESIPLKQQSFFLIGRQVDSVDIVSAHASTSRIHAVLQFHESGSLWLQDLGSAHGTFINRQRVTPKQFIQIHVGDQIRIGQSTRSYVVEGPEEMRPKEKEVAVTSMQQRQRALTPAQQQKQRTVAAANAALLESKQRFGANAKEDGEEDDEDGGGATWGMGEDAVNSDSDQDDSETPAASLMINDDGSTTIVSSTGSQRTARLTPSQQRLLEQIDRRRSKLNSLIHEVEVIKSKDIRQGGLSEGQERQIARNQQRIETITQEVEEMEMKLQESVNKVEGDRERSRKERENKSRKQNDGEEDADMGSDSDDEFFDRTKKKPATPSKDATTSSTTESTVSSSFLSTLTPLSSLSTPESIAAELPRLVAKRDQLRMNMQELIILDQKEKRMAAIKTQQSQPSKTASASSSSSDSLDSYMSSLNAQNRSQRIQTIKTNLQTLQAHYIRLQRLMEQKKGERIAQAYREGDLDAFKKAAAEKSATAAAAAAAAAPSTAPYTAQSVATVATKPDAPPSSAVQMEDAISSITNVETQPIRANTTESTVPHSTLQPAASAHPAPVAVASHTPTPPSDVQLSSSTAAMIARAQQKKAAAERRASKAEAAAQRQRDEESVKRAESEMQQMQQMQQQSAAASSTSQHVEVLTREKVRAMIDAEAPKPPPDRYSLLAQQIEAARARKDYNATAGDDLSRTLKEHATMAARAAANGATGLEGVRGGLLVRKRPSDSEQPSSHPSTTDASISSPLAKRLKTTAPPVPISAPRMVGPTSAPHMDEELIHQQEEQSIDWQPPSQSSQQKLRAKFAGRY